MGIISDFKSFNRMNEDLGRNFVVTIHSGIGAECDVVVDGKDGLLVPAEDDLSIFGPYTKVEADKVCKELNERVKELDSDEDIFYVYELTHNIESELQSYIDRAY